MINKISATYQAEHSKLLKYIRSKVSRLEDAEDIAQDVFYQALINLNALVPVEDLMAWLFSVARNRIIDWYRKKKPLELSPEDELGIEDLVSECGFDRMDAFTKNLVSVSYTHLTLPTIYSV